MNMKMILLAHVLIAMMLLGCGIIGTKDETKEFIPGTFIRFSKNEFGKLYDTLTISLQNSAANEYKIVHKSNYERMVDGNKLIPEYRKKENSAIYDPVHKFLQETNTGKIYSIDVKGNCLFNGPNKYQKL